MKRFILSLLLIFLSGTLSAESWNGPTEKRNPRMNYFLHTGFQFDAVLRTAIFSFNTITPVVAQTEYDITFLGKVMIPRNTKLIGVCNVEKSVNRVNIVFHSMVFPNGQEIRFTGIALHTDGSGGIPGKVDKQKASIPAKILIAAAAAQASTTATNSVPVDMIKGIADDVNQELSQKQDYSITIKKDVPIQVFVTESIEY